MPSHWQQSVDSFQLDNVEELLNDFFNFSSASESFLWQTNFEFNDVGDTKANGIKKMMKIKGYEEVTIFSVLMITICYVGVVMRMKKT